MGKTIVAWLVVPIWIALSALGLYLASGFSMSAFDPQGFLYQRINQPDFDSVFVVQMNGAFDEPLIDTVVHIANAEQCLCQVSSSRHINTVKSLAVEQGKRNVEVSIESIPYLQSVVTTTPAIAVFDGDGRLSYLGPYSTGVGCFTGNGQVEPYLTYEAEVGAVVPVDVSGCYCVNQQAKPV